MPVSEDNDNMEHFEFHSFGRLDFDFNIRLSIKIFSVSKVRFFNTHGNTLIVE